MSTVPIGPTTITFGDRMIVRRKGFVEIKELTCPDRHGIRRGAATIRGDGALTCTNHGRTPGAKERAGECGALLYLLNIPGQLYQHRFYAADVTIAELRLWEHKRFAPQDVLRYLGAWFG